MNTLIFRTIAPIIVVTMLVFSVFVLLVGHNEPGGGFIGGLIGAASTVIYSMAAGVPVARKALRVHPITIAGFGVFIAALSGLVSLAAGVPYLTGLWTSFDIGGSQIALSTPLLFDIGVYCVVFGTLSAIALGLESGEAG
ncbi:MAG: Na(+) antiporter subunit [Hyphomicrobiales bacterium]|nr:Na(+) antiporter subunit [Hyphomicrobiales bacterium]